MGKKLAIAMVVMGIGIGFVAAEEFAGVITKVEGKKISFYKTAKKGKKDGDEITKDAAEKIEVVKGKFNKDDKKFVAGDAIPEGLKAEIFTKIGEKGVAARITTDADGKTITNIMVIGGGKKKKDAN